MNQQLFQENGKWYTLDQVQKIRKVGPYAEESKITDDKTDNGIVGGGFIKSEITPAKPETLVVGTSNLQKVKTLLGIK